LKEIIVYFQPSRNLNDEKPNEPKTIV